MIVTRADVLNGWLLCPYCNKRLFEVGEETKIVGLQYQCKYSRCKKLFRIELEPTESRETEI